MTSQQHQSIQQRLGETVTSQQTSRVWHCLFSYNVLGCLSFFSSWDFYCDFLGILFKHIKEVLQKFTKRRKKQRKAKELHISFQALINEGFIFLLCSKDSMRRLYDFFCDFRSLILVGHLKTTEGRRCCIVNQTRGSFCFNQPAQWKNKKNALKVMCST